MNYPVHLLFMILIVGSATQHCFAQAKNKITTLTETEFRAIGKIPPVLKEASGLYIDKDGLLWSHNDDRLPVLYCFDTLGNVIKTIYLNHNNIGWEAITTDSLGNIYIGAIGNNKNDRKDLTIIKIKPLHTISEKITQGELIRFSYANQTDFPPTPDKKNYDSDALIFNQGFLYIFTKNRTNPNTGFTRIYQVSPEPGTHKAMLVDSIFTGKGSLTESWITDAALSPDKKMLALLGHDKIWLITNFKNHLFSKGNIEILQLPHFTHKAGIAFRDNTLLYVVDEKEFDILGGNIYRLDIKPRPEKK